MLDTSKAAAVEKQVFIIDDDADVRSSLSSLLRSVGLQAATFSSAAEFLSSEKPDVPSCLVLDVRLPGIGGIEFQAELAKANIRLPIIFITGHGDIPMTVRAMKAGAVEFLTKPFRDQDLLDAVRTGLDRDSERREREQALSGVVSAYETLSAREKEVQQES
jgi:FixJ family two-component response regulator